MGDHQLQVSVRVVSAGAAPVGPLAVSQGSAAMTVEIDNATFVLGGLKLETAGLDNTVDWVYEQSEVVPLDLSGDAILVFDTDVPAGTYKELELSIDKLEVGNPAEDPLITQYPLLADASVLVEGTVDGTPFAFTAPLDIDLELLFHAPKTFVDGEPRPVLVELAIETSGWFMGAIDMLDPNDPANQSAIEGSIQASLELHEDD
jgi:hypothetical protein